jgi:hypothetical protein
MLAPDQTDELLLEAGIVQNSCLAAICIWLTAPKEVTKTSNTFD